jgi:hypothetical protein
MTVPAIPDQPAPPEQTAPPLRPDVVAMLATYGERQPEQVPEEISSLELAWLMHQLEQRYGMLDVDDDMITRMSTVTGVLGVLKDLRVGLSHHDRRRRHDLAGPPQGDRLGGRDRRQRPQRVRPGG